MSRNLSNKKTSRKYFSKSFLESIKLQKQKFLYKLFNQIFFFFFQKKLQYHLLQHKE